MLCGSLERESHLSHWVAGTVEEGTQMGSYKQLVSRRDGAGALT